MKVKRLFANALLKGFGLRRLKGTRVQAFVRAFLDEIDLQCFRDSNPCPRFGSRTEMYRHINDMIGPGPIDYLEFGVHRGDSFREWTVYNQHPESRFYGFDSFEGLPEKWRDKQEAGHFDVGGAVPEIADPRVSFVKGWFDATLPVFSRNFTAINRLLIHLDADLYGSTMVPLIYLAPRMNKGSLLIFDEFYDRDHEFKAWQDFLRISRVAYRVICEMGNFGRLCIEIQ